MSKRVITGKGKHRYRPYDDPPPISQNLSGSDLHPMERSPIASAQYSQAQDPSSGEILNQLPSTDSDNQVRRIKEEIEDQPNDTVHHSDQQNTECTFDVQRKIVKEEIPDETVHSDPLQQPKNNSVNLAVVKAEIVETSEESHETSSRLTVVNATEAAVINNTPDVQATVEGGSSPISEVRVEGDRSSNPDECADFPTENLEEHLAINENDSYNKFVDVGRERPNCSSSGKTIATFDAPQPLDVKSREKDHCYAKSSAELGAKISHDLALKLGERNKMQTINSGLENIVDTTVKEEVDSLANDDVDNNQEECGESDFDNDDDDLEDEDEDEDEQSNDLVVEEDVEFESNSADNAETRDSEGNWEPDSEMNCVEDEIYESDEEESSDAESSEIGDQFMECDGINADKGTRQKYSLFPTAKDKGDLICSITPRDVADFHNQTRRWYTENRPTNSYHGHGNIPMTSVKPVGTCALYRVVSSDGTKLRLQAITVDLWLDGRGDLREIGMTMHAVNTLCGKGFDTRRHIFPGDVIIVQQLIPSRFGLKKGSWEEVINTDAREFHKNRFLPLWNVKEYQLLERITLPDRLAVSAEREYFCRKRNHNYYYGAEEEEEEDVIREIKTLFLAIEGVPDLFRINTKHLPSECTEQDAVMLGTVLVPRGRSAVFSFMPKNLHERQQLFDKYTAAGKNIPPKFGFLFSRLATEMEDKYLKRRDSIYQIFSRDYATGTIWLRRGLALAVPSLGAFERFFMDTDPHTIVVNITKYDNDFVRFEFQVNGQQVQLRKRAWRSDRNILVELANGSSITSRVTRVIPIKHGLKIEAKATGTDAMTLNRYDKQTVVVQQVAPTISGLEEEFYSSNEPLDIVEGHRFHRALIAAFGGPALRSINIQPTTHVITYKNRKRTLLNEQAHALEAALKSSSAFAVPASFGSGKTLTANVLLCHLSEVHPTKLHLIVAQSNYAVVNAVNIASNFDDYKHLRIVRMISPQNMGLREERTEFDLPVLMRQLFSSPDELNRLSFDDRRIAENYLRLIGHTEDLSWNAKERINRWKRRDWSNAVRIFFQLYQPRRIFCTTSTLLLLTKNDGGMGRAWTDSVDTLIFDEASQLSTPTFALLAHRLPLARPILIGDSKQLEPFVPTTNSPFLRKMATGNLLENITRNGLWSSLTINSVFRCHPELTHLLSETFYHNQLRPAVSAAERSGMLHSVRMPNPKYPIAMFDVSGHEIQHDTSYINEEEELCAVKIADILTKFVENDNDIAIICMYRAQADNIAKRVRDTNIFVGTVDATQGREFRASIVCTTRTTEPKEGPDGVNFFTHSKRVNVALSRSKELLIILGDVDVIEKMDNWRKIYDSILKKDACSNVGSFLKDNKGF